MFLIRKRILYIVFLLSLVPTLTLGLYAAYILHALNITRDLRIKYYAEHFVYLTILFTLFLFILLLTTALRSRKIFRELDKIANIQQRGGNHANLTQYLARMGKLGEKINILFFQLNELNEMKSLKISSQGNLNNFLIENIGLKLLVMNPMGRITHCSKKVLTKLETTNAALINRNIGEIALELPWVEITSEIAKKRTLNTRQDIKFREPFKYKGDCVFYPIFDLRGHLANVVCLLENDGISGELAGKTEQMNGAEKKGKVTRLLDTILKSKSK